LEEKSLIELNKKPVVQVVEEQVEVHVEEGHPPEDVQLHQFKVVDEPVLVVEAAEGVKSEAIIQDSQEIVSDSKEEDDDEEPVVQMVEVDIQDDIKPADNIPPPLASNSGSVSSSPNSSVILNENLAVPGKHRKSALKKTGKEDRVGGNMSVEFEIDPFLKVKLELLYAGQILKKSNKFGIGQEREFWVDRQNPYLRWSKPGKRLAGASLGMIPLSSIRDVQTGPLAKSATLGILLISSKRNMYVEAPTTEIRDEWATALDLVCSFYRKIGESSDDDNTSEYNE